jgi:branched-chain amino acid transport system substrate-binding protein
MHKPTMAKVGAVILGAALVGAACGSDNSSSSSGAAATTAASGGATTTAAASGASTSAAAGGATTTAAAGGGGGAVAMPTGAKCSGLALGFFGAYTGADSGLGIPIYNGEQLAIDQFNEKNPDCKIELKKYDSQGSPDQAPQLARSIVGDASIVGVVGPAFSGESKNADPIFNEAVLPIITPSATNAQLQTNGWTIFHRLLANDATQGPGVAKYINDTLKSAKVFVIDDASEYGKGLADQVRQTLGSKVVGSDTIDPKASDFSSTVTKVKSANPDAVFFGGYYSAAGPLSKQLRDGGVTNAKLVFGDGVKDNKYMELGGSAAEGAFISCTCAPSPADFAAAYKAKFNTDPSTYAPEAYDSALAFLTAIAAGKTTRKDINDYLKTIDIKGVTKQIKFDNQGEVATKAVYMYTVKSGKLTDAGTVS